KVSPPFKQAQVDIKHGAGISREREIIDLGAQAGVVDKSGAWYSYSGARIGQGKDNVREYLKQNPQIAIEIENKVRENHGIVSRAAAFPPSEAEAEADSEAWLVGPVLHGRSGGARTSPSLMM